ncbi:RING finger protein 222 [Antechinus flavipes]|uniref:RING finger protein 222 n=1 Tax=Antechinus flavipes TaxID=38775 RepID=UPI0022369BCE|nr:RING finger protein 222 [Antechinus flavipes]
MSEGESKESVGSECPVCYEKFRDLEGASRTLSCGHVFCHDCLVKYLLSCKVDGQIQRTIICPICRYVTFLSKKSSRWPSLSSEKNLQTLVVPMGLDNLPLLDVLGHTNPLTIPHPLWVPSQGQTNQSPFPRDLLPGIVQEPQIFIISPHGMPLREEDSVLPRQSLANLSEVSPAQRSSLCSRCCHSRVMVLIALITIVAVIATILPWILLVRKEA